MPLDTQRAALERLGETPAQRGKTLMLVANENKFDPAKSAEAITPLLLELPKEAVFAISADLDTLLDSNEQGLRSAAVILKVKAGVALVGLAERDPAALMQAVESLPTDQAPGGLADQLIELARAGQLEPAPAINQAARVTRDTAALFEQLAPLIDASKDIGYDQWSDAHALGMAALAGMHAIEDERWPEGYDGYRIARADPEVIALGKKHYMHEEKGCVKCHGHHGEGTEGFPPLALSPWVLGDPVRGATIVKHGLKGELPNMINPSTGEPYNAQMEPLSYFSNGEMAAILTYVRQSWGNFAAPVTAQDVANSPPAPDGMMWDAAALEAKFPFERERLMETLPAPKIDVIKWAPPKLGLYVMLASVTVTLGLILGGTMLGGGHPDQAHAASPAVA